MILSNHPKIRVNFGCHREERSDVTIPKGLASISTFGIIEAMPLWIAAHSFRMLAMTCLDPDNPIPRHPVSPFHHGILNEAWDLLTKESNNETSCILCDADNHYVVRDITHE